MPKYDLEERTAKFGKAVLEFANALPITPITMSLINQLVRAATSVGANYMEADGAESKKDFQHKIAVCKKEAKETRHWLRMIAKTQPSKIEQCRILWKEADELVLIFSSIIRSSKKGGI